MSLIEEALRKAVLDITHEQRVVPLITRPAVKNAINVSQLEKYREFTLDSAALRKNLILPELKEPSALRSYKILRTRVAQRMHKNGWFSIGVTGLGIGEGKSLTAINLAFALSQNVSTCVDLLDLDLQRPRIAACLGLKRNSGLLDYLVGHAVPEDVLYTPRGYERLSIIPNFTPSTHSSDVISDPRMDELLAWLRGRMPQRLIVCDLPPILSSDDVLVVAPKLDCMLFVVSEGETPRAGLAQLNDMLKGMNLLGVVLNKSMESMEGGYYY